MENYDRIYARIDLDAVSGNLKAIAKKLSPHTEIIAVIKADAYGHGAVEIAKETEAFPKLFGFAVATGQEALWLRKNGIKKPIMVLGYTFGAEYGELIKNGIRPTVFTYEMAQAYAKAAVLTGTKAYIHIKIDTGMSRLGYQVTKDAADEIARIAALPGIEIEGLFTHFARADEADKSVTKAQLDAYKDMVRMLEKRHVRFAYRHVSNSAAIAELPEANLDLVRAGIILYGLWPSDEVKRDSVPIKPVMQIKSKIVHIKRLEAGRRISYGGTYCLNEPRMVATIPAGYADGYPRSLSNKGYVLIHGKKAPILGRICMDQFMVDVTDIPDARLLDTVTLLGEDGGSVLSMETLASLSGRFNYEFACDITKRVPRLFFKNNRLVSANNNFLDG